MTSAWDPTAVNEQFERKKSSHAGRPTPLFALLRWNQPGLEALESMVTVVAVTTVGTSAQYWVEYTRGRVFR